MKQKTRQKYYKRLQRVIDFIAQNLEQDCDVNTLADIACMSPYHFHRIYREMMNETVNGTVRRMRLQQAAAALIRTNVPIADIAKKYNYRSNEAFSRAFLKQYNESPNQYRQRCDDIMLDAPLGEALLDHYEDKNMFDVNIVEFPETKLIGYEHQGDYMQIGQVFERLFMFAAQNNLLTESTRSFGLYEGDPKSMALEDLRSKACITTQDTSIVELDAELKLINIPKMVCAQLIFKGAYAELETAYDYLFGIWLPESGYEAGDFPAIEEYLNDPKETPPAQLLTAVYCPLKS